MAEFLSDTKIKKTRKPHMCIGCTTTIAKGSEAIVSKGVICGEFINNYYHPDCREAELMLNRRSRDLDFYCLHEFDEIRSMLNYPEFESLKEKFSRIIPYKLSYLGPY